MKDLVAIGVSLLALGADVVACNRPSSMSTLSLVGIAFEVPLVVEEADARVTQQFDNWVAEWRSTSVEVSYLRTTICASDTIKALPLKNAHGLVITIEEIDGAIVVRTTMDQMGTCHSIGVAAKTIIESRVIASEIARTIRYVDDAGKVCLQHVSADKSTVSVRNEAGIVRNLQVGDAASSAFGLINEIRTDAAVIVELVRNRDVGVFEEQMRTVKMCKSAR